MDFDIGAANCYNTNVKSQTRSTRTKYKAVCVHIYSG